MLEQSKPDNRSPIEIIRYVESSGEYFSREEHVPLSCIVRDGTPIDENHARDLGNLMVYGHWGVTQPILLRARRGDTNPEEVVYDVLDGYHRIEGIGIISPESDPTIKAQVLYNCSEADMFDQRILAANSVDAVKFARLGYWMRGAWEQTDWKDKITVAQAFSLANNKSSGSNLHLSEEEAREIKEWADDKARKWSTDAGSIAQNLRLIEKSSQELALRVRTGSFTKGQLAITPTQFSDIVSAFPHAKDLQMQIAKYANAHGLSSKRLSLLVGALKETDLSDAAIAGVLNQDAWKVRETQRRKPPAKRESRRVDPGPRSTQQSLASESIVYSFDPTRDEPVHGDGREHKEARSRQLRDMIPPVNMTRIPPPVAHHLQEEAAQIQETLKAIPRVSTQVKLFIDRWIDDPQSRKLLRGRDDTAVEQVEKMLCFDNGDAVLDFIIKFEIVKRVFDKDVDVRDAAGELVKHMSLEGLTRSRLSFLFGYMKENFQRLQPGSTEAQDVLETFVELFPYLSSLYNHIPEEFAAMQKAMMVLVDKARESEPNFLRDGVATGSRNGQN